MSDAYVRNIIILVSVHVFWDLKSLTHVLFMRSKYGPSAGGFLCSLLPSVGLTAATTLQTPSELRVRRQTPECCLPVCLSVCLSSDASC